MRLDVLARVLYMYCTLRFIIFNFLRKICLSNLLSTITDVRFIMIELSSTNRVILFTVQPKTK